VISHDALREAIRSLGYTFKRQADRVEIYKQRGSIKRVELRRVDLHDENAARSVLRQAGMSGEDIEAFISNQRV
jgi:hypothetical protein